MAESKKEERARQFYQQAQEAHSKGSINFFDSRFTVPAENLYIEAKSAVSIDKSSIIKHNFKQIFDARLKKMLDEKQVFNFGYLSKDIVKTIERMPSNTFYIYFGIPIKKSSRTPLPFGKRFKLLETQFTWITRKQFERQHNKECLTSFYSQCKKNLMANDNLEWVMKGFYFFRAAVDSTDEQTAVNTVADHFEVLSVSATVAQERGVLRHSMFVDKTRSRSPVPNAGILLATTQDHSKCEIFWDSDVRMKSDESLSFTTDAKKMDSFRQYKKICSEKTPISERIRLYIFEFARALHAQDPHIRQLSLWRCLEIATSKQGASRPEDEIIQIVGNYYKGPHSLHWKQQGKLIKKQRNLFVHQGTSLERDSWGSVDKYLNWSHEYARDTLSILLWMRKNKVGKKSTEIDDFFDFYIASDEALRIGSKLLRARDKPR